MFWIAPSEKDTRARPASFSPSSACFLGECLAAASVWKVTGSMITA